MSPSRWICMGVMDVALPENCPQKESCTNETAHDRITDTLLIFTTHQTHHS